MDENAESFFSWTSRRIVLPHGATDEEASRPPGLVMDCRPIPERPDVRLLVYHDDTNDADYDAVVIGRTDGANDIPVITTPEECLLVAAARAETGPAIVLAAPTGDDLGKRVREVTNQILRGGPLLCLILCTGALSVLLPLHSSTPDTR
ncbi:hypothetical protein [Rhodococcus sp. CH91]|uniref:hypothetical protein n=1 Tax=Rhodococcus sp. CH91 TaxID=2910256 RepID=UPI001F4A5E30|nr:hypothetical protein [Rhodococcus sp. CH91]